MFCPECGKKVADNVKFCTHCGCDFKKHFSSHNDKDPALIINKGDSGLDKSTIHTDKSDKSASVGGSINIQVGAEKEKTASGQYCPICGDFIRIEESFRCPDCKRSFLCRRHRKEGYKICEECAAPLIAAQRDKEAKEKEAKEKEAKERGKRIAALRKRINDELQREEYEKVRNTLGELRDLLPEEERSQIPEYEKEIADDLQNEAESALAREKYERAAYLFRRALMFGAAKTHVEEKLDEISLAYSKRGSDTSDEGGDEDAIVQYTKAIELDPDNAEAYSDRASAYDMKEDYNKAIADYTRAIKLDPDNAEFYHDRGWAYYMKSDRDNAIAEFTRAIEFDRKRARFYHSRATAYEREGDYDKAIADYTREIKLDRDDARAYINRALAYEMKGDCDKAIADYTRAIKLDRDNAGFYHDRGLQYELKGKYSKAIADYNKAIELDPDRADYYSGSRARAIGRKRQGYS